MAVLFAFQNTGFIFNIPLCGYNMVTVIFKYDSDMVVIRIVEYPIKKNNFPSRRMKSSVIPKMVFNAVICLRPLLPGYTARKGTRRFFWANRDFVSG